MIAPPKRYVDDPVLSAHQNDVLRAFFDACTVELENIGRIWTWRRFFNQKLPELKPAIQDLEQFRISRSEKRKVWKRAALTPAERGDFDYI
nr:hypothetical protein [Candidatus Sigynarchaeum springense]